MKAKYALRALIVLAKHPAKTLQSKAIAREADTPVKFLEAILQELKLGGFITAKRGIFGGYALAKPADAIPVGAIIRLLDGTFAPIRCASISDYKKCDDCTDEAICGIRAVMLEVRNAIAGVLDHKSLAEIADKEKEYRQDAEMGLPQGYIAEPNSTKTTEA